MNKVHSQREEEVYLFFTESRLALGPTQPSLLWVSEGGGRVSFPDHERQASETSHSSAYGVEVKNAGPIPAVLHTSSWSDDHLNILHIGVYDFREMFRQRVQF